MITLAIASQKGGVGKTTVAVNLAYAIAQRGWTTLLVDTDPQGSVGMSLSRRAKERRGIFDSLCGDVPIDQSIIATRLPELKVLTSGRSDPFLEESIDPDLVGGRMATIFNDLDRLGFDVILVDTPAGLRGITTEVLRASSHLLVPLQAEPLAARSIPVLFRELNRLQKSGASPEFLGVIFTMLQESAKESRDVETAVKELIPSRLILPQRVLRDATFLEASARGVPVALLGGLPASAALAFDQVAAEIESRIGLRLPTDGDEEDGHTALMD